MKTLGKYELVEEIGRGGFAVVYRARDTELNRDVALKILHPQLTIDVKFLQRFHQEGQAAARLNHPNIVTIYEVGKEAGQHYLAMTYLPGRTLDKWLTEGSLPVETAVSVVEQIASALDAIHEQGLVHRDVKPGNVILDEAGRATLLDFGIVRAAEGTRLTTTMAVLGTPEYMAPEQAEIDEAAGVDWRADIYALGLMAYQMLVGRPPFVAKSATAVLYKQVHEPPPAPTSLNPDLPSNLESVLLKALEKKREERFQQAGDFAATLRQVLTVESQTQQRDAQLADLYRRLQTAAKAEDWAEVLTLGGEIRALDPAYRDVPAFLKRARVHMGRPSPKSKSVQEPKQPVSESEPFQWIHQPPSESQSTQRLKALPRWIWGVGGVVILGFLVVLVMRGLSWQTSRESSQTPTATGSSFEPIRSVLGDTWTRPVDRMVMVYVPAGQFEMGSTDGDSAEQPVHTVALDGFWIDQYEVSNAQYQKCVQAGRCQAPSSCDQGNLTYGETDKAAHPVTCTDWQDAQDYCEWAGGRLPTEAEWEYAARGPENYIYPWGDNGLDCDRANYKDCVGSTRAVGSYPVGASWCGVQDLAGNVWEWVADWYGAYSSEQQIDPTGPSRGVSRVLRGGSWTANSNQVRSVDRYGDLPMRRTPDVGFRCVKD